MQEVDQVMNSKHTQAQIEYMVNHPGRHFFFVRDRDRVLRGFADICPAATIKHQQGRVEISPDHYIQVSDRTDKARGIELTTVWYDEAAEISEADVAFLESRVR